MNHVHTALASPLGLIDLYATAEGLTGVYFAEHRHRVAIAARDDARAAHLRHAARELEAYFAHELTHFTVPLSPAGTAFQQRVWRGLGEIAYGDTESYAALARRIERPLAVRAVGAANGRNPLSIVVPCHRVIAAGGALTGYAGGLPRKDWLLKHERAHKGATRGARHLHPEVG